MISGPITGALENIDAMAIGGVFFRAAVASSNQCSCNRGECTAPRKESLQKCRANAERGVQNLRSRHVSKILMRNFVSQHSA